jgi:hypothetical protein
MEGECQHCHHYFKIKAIPNITYHGIDSHHLHPKLLNNPKGLGQQIDLCRKCHIEILHPLLLEIVRKYSNRKTGNSLQWLWLYVPYENKEKCIEEVKSFTLNWLEKDDDTKTTTTSLF